MINKNKAELSSTPYAKNYNLKVGPKKAGGRRNSNNSGSAVAPTKLTRNSTNANISRANSSFHRKPLNADGPKRF